MRAEHIKYFLALAENHSITKTSLEFYTTHQSVSKAIRQLEEEMETQLFTRSQKGMTLTPQGELMLPVARQTKDAFHRLRLQLTHLDRCQSMEGLLHIIGTPVSNVTTTQNLIEDFRTLYPHVRYQVDELNAAEAMRYIALHQNSLGLMVVMHDPAYHTFYKPYIDQVKLFPLQKDEYICLAGANSPLAEKKAISFQEFIQHPIAMLQMEGELDFPFTQLLRQKADIEPMLLTESRHLYTQAIEQGNYVGASSRHTSSKSTLFSHSDIVLIPFEDDLTLDIMLATHKHPELDEVSQAFVDMVCDYHE